MEHGNKNPRQATLVIGYPCTTLYIRDTVNKGDWRQRSLKKAAAFSTVLYTIVFMINTLLVRNGHQTQAPCSRE